MDTVERGTVRIGAGEARVNGRVLAGLAAALATVTLIGVVAATSLVGGRAVVGEPTADRSYDAIEAHRALSGVTITADRSYDAIEAHRALSGVTITADRSYDAIEAHRALSGVTITADRSYDAIERLRGSATSN